MVSEKKLDLLYYLFSEKFLSENPNINQIIIELENKKKAISLSHYKIRDYFRIKVNPTSEISSYLNVLTEKILHQNCKPETELTDRMDLVSRLISVHNFYSLIYPQEKINPELKKYLDLVENFKFNDEKIEALSVFLEFLKTKKDAIYILKGAAGTGKTTLVRYFLDFYKHLYGTSNFVLMAPTGKAARVLESKTKITCQTIHKHVYEYRTSVEKKTDKFNDDNFFNDSKELQKNYLSDYEIAHADDYEIILNQYLSDKTENLSFAIVDEASMVTDFRSEEELRLEHNKQSKQGKRFHNCTGYHLDDIIAYIRQSNKFVKLIFVGDSYQLPPIQSGHEKFIPALDKNFFKQKYSKFKIFTFQLNQSFRFANEEIYFFSMFLRDKIEKIFSKGKLNIYFNYRPGLLLNEFKVENPDIHFTEYRNLNEMLADVKNDISSGISNIILTWRNDTSNYINNEIRNSLGRKYLIEPNDKLVCTKNNYQTFIMNGEHFTVLKINKVKFKDVINLRLGISQLIPYFNVDIKFDNSGDVVTSTNVVLDMSELYFPTKIKWHKSNRFMSNNHRDIKYLLDKELKSRLKFRFYLSVKKLLSDYFDNVQFGEEEILTKEKIEKLIGVFKIVSKNEIDNLNVDEVIDNTKNEFYSFIIKNIQNDEFYNSIVCRYGYSITCHKSQGSEWQNVYITDINPNDMCWLYTAVTRASKSVSFLDANISIANNLLNFKPFFRLIRNFEGEILNVKKISLLSINEMADFILSCFMDNYKMVLYREVLDYFDISDKIILIETTTEYYYLPSDMMNAHDFESYNKVKSEYDEIKISFSYSKNKSGRTRIVDFSHM